MTDTKENDTKLKPFQKRSADHVYEQLFGDEEGGTNRFLLADEVGLGKTFVAKEVLRRLYEEADEDLFVAYICSNLDIARQNAPELDVTSESEDGAVVAKRLSLLAHEIEETGGEQFRLAAVTPGTSLDLTRRDGKKEERELLWALLEDALEVVLSSERDFEEARFEQLDEECAEYLAENFENAEWLSRMLRSQVKPENWLKSYPHVGEDLCPEIVKQFWGRVTRGDLEHARTAKDDFPYPEGWGKEDAPEESSSDERLKFIGKMRRHLAEAAIDYLRADLIILDEFQRFSHLLAKARNVREADEGSDEYDEEHLFVRLTEPEYVAERDDDDGPGVLLLSATPFDLYTRTGGGIDSHFEQFVSTLKYLLPSDEREDEPEVVGSLREYRRELSGLSDEEQNRDGADGGALESPTGRLERVVDVDLKFDIEQELKQVMLRTERTQHQRVSERPVQQNDVTLEGEVGHEYLLDYTRYVSLAHLTGRRPRVDKWKAASYLASFMDLESPYALIRDVRAAFEDEPPGDWSEPEWPADEEHHRALADDLAALSLPMTSEAESLENGTFESYDEISFRNARVEHLAEHVIGGDSEIDRVDEEPPYWKLLWIPPSVPYWDYGEPFSKVVDAAGVEDTSGAGQSAFTKTLVFSHYRMVPRAVSVLLSYEAERRMRAENQPDGSDHDYHEYAEGRSRLLDFGDSRSDALPVFSLLYPCWTLATEFEPAAYAGRERVELDEEIESIIDRLIDKAETLERAEHSVKTTERAAEAMVLLDSEYAPSAPVNIQSGLQTWLGNDAEIDFDRRDSAAKSSQVLTNIVQGDGGDEEWKISFSDLFAGETKGATPLRVGDDVVELLTKLTLASPAICSFRSFLGCFEVGDELAAARLASAASHVAFGFRARFNRAWVTDLVMGVYDEDSPYVEKVLDYCSAGNVQALLDEYVHVLRDEHSGKYQQSSRTALEIAEEIYRVMSIRAANLGVTQWKNEDGEPVRQRGNPRVHYALPFGVKVDSERGEEREIVVRDAFNSPFHPFVLASTSVGKEGLDFHRYARRVCHWSLPGNPYDLEQREGRIDRYKCHTVRANVARDCSEPVLESFDETQPTAAGRSADPWEEMFELANQRSSDQSGLKPEWIYEPEEEARLVQIERLIPSFPGSRDNRRLARLEEELILYRLGFGQPRQRNLIEALRQLEGKFGDAGLHPEEFEECVADLVEKCALELEPEEEMKCE